MKRKIFTLSFIIAILLTACGGNTPASPTSDINALYTMAAETVIAELTQTAAVNSATPEAIATKTQGVSTATVVPTSHKTATPIFTETPSATAIVLTQVPPTDQFCDNAAFVGDVSVPDNTEMTPGQHFEKTWRIKNTGTCTWGEGYRLVFGYDEKMSGQPRPLSTTVFPNETVEVTVVLTAPSEVGKYRSYWRMANIAGANFGEFFFVDIVVR
jgi:hypothetical protein